MSMADPTRPGSQTTEWRATQIAGLAMGVLMIALPLLPADSRLYVLGAAALAVASQLGYAASRTALKLAQLVLDAWRRPPSTADEVAEIVRQGIDLAREAWGEVTDAPPEPPANAGA